MQKNRSIEANVDAAKEAVRQMQSHWQQWKKAQNPEAKSEAIAGYAAAFTSCKVYIENYLRQLYPNERDVPNQVTQDIKKIVETMDVIEKASEKKLNRVIQDIEQLRRDAA